MLQKKSVAQNYIYNLIYQILVLLLPLITIPYLSRVLGAEGVGIYGFTFSILSYFVLFGCLGIALYGQREIATVQDDITKRSKVFWELFYLKLIMICFSFIIFAILNFSNETYGIYYKILTIELFSNVIDITWFYQGIEDFKKITIRNAIVRLVTLGLIFLFVKEETDLVKYFLINGVTNFLSYLSLWLNINKYITKVSLKKLNIIRTFKTYYFIIYTSNCNSSIYCFR